MELTDIKARRAYFDTNIFIYLLEENPQYFQATVDLAAYLESIQCKIFTSELTLAECLVKPFADNDIQSQDAYVQSIANSAFLTVEPITKKTLIRAAQLRAKLKNKLPDSIHLATALDCDCDLFVGNDKKIKTQGIIKTITL